MTQIEKRLPSSYSLDDSQWLLYHPGNRKAPEKVSNYYPLVTGRIKGVDSQGEIAHFVVLKLVVEGKLTEEQWTIPFGKLETFDFNAIVDTHCYDEMPKASRHIAKIVRFQMRNFEERPVNFYTALGWATYQGAPAYVAGDKVITNDGIVSARDYMIFKNLRQFHLDVLPENEYSVKEIIRDVLQILSIDKVASPILLANTFAGLSRSLFVDANLPIRYVVYLVGPSQAGKTTLACLTGSLYNRNTDEKFSLTPLVSTQTAIEEKVSLFHDTTYIIDDLFPEKGSTGMKARERTLMDLIRIIGEGKEKQRRCGKETIGYSPNAAVICTGEYLLGSLSSLARCIVLHMNQELNWKTVNELSRNPLLLPTVALHYLRWAAANYEKIVRQIREEHAQFRDLMVTIHTSYPRVRENYFTVKMGMKLLLEFCLEQQAITQEQSAAIMEIFQAACDYAFERQKFDMNNLKEKYEIVDALIVCLKNKKFHLVEEDYYTYGEQDGMVREDTLCLDPDKIQRILKEELGISKLSTQAITKQLFTLNLLNEDQSSSHTMKINKHRMIVISKNKLEKYVLKKEE